MKVPRLYPVEKPSRIHSIVTCSLVSVPSLVVTFQDIRRVEPRATVAAVVGVMRRTVDVLVLVALIEAMRVPVAMPRVSIYALYVVVELIVEGTVNEMLLLET